MSARLRTIRSRKLQNMPRTSDHETIAHRLVEILRRLNEGQSLHPKALAEEFRVHERTIRRDLNDRFAFLGLERADDRYTLPQLRLGTFSLQDLQRFASLAGMQGAFPRLSTEFLKDILDSNDHSAMLIRGHNHEDLKASEREFEQLKAAIEEHRLVEFEYCKTDGSKKIVEVAPYKLILQNGIWYLQATDGGQIKSYALTRIDRLLTLPTPFSPDAEIVNYLLREDTIWLNFHKTEVVLKVAPPAAAYFQRRKLIGGQKIEKVLEDGALIVSGLMAHQDQILPVVRYWIPCVRIISPEGLQGELDSQLKSYLGTS